MERRVFSAILLSFVVLFGYQMFFAPAETPPPQQRQAAQPAGGPAAAAQTPTVASAPPPQMAQPLVADALARDVVVETDVVRAVFNTRGAVITSWKLKRYTGADKQPLDLVPSDLPAGEVRPFTLKTGDATLDAQLANALFKPGDVGSDHSISFEYRDASGLVARKRFALNTYLINFSAAVERNGQKTPLQIAFGPSLGPGYNQTGSSYYYPPGALFSEGADATRLQEKHITPQSRHHSAYDWAGVSDHYFLFAIIPPDGQQVAVNFTPVRTPVPGSTDPAAVRTFVSWTADATPDQPVNVFFGPKDFDILKAADATLVLAIDFGMFAWLVVPLLMALKWVNGYIGNWGWSIIVLTLLINAVMAPLRHKSLVSMRKLQRMQPEIKAIQKRYEKYKMTDPERQKMNTEMMTLYRERGVNPASGCVPMLLTMPVLFAFYALLSVAIELRGAPWMGWITDLSAHDPLYITPLLMGGTMFWQQYITPSTADPVQQKVMLLMPVIFTVTFLWFPSGLVLYWLFSNLWAIGQQLVTNRLGDPVVVTTAQAPAVRRLKQQQKKQQ